MFSSLVENQISQLIIVSYIYKMEYTKRQIEIMKAATDLISDGGIQSLTTKALAKKMNFSESALYRHFNDKTEILSSLLNYYRIGLKETIQSIFVSDTNGEEKLKKIMEYQFLHFSKNPAIVMVIFAETSFQYDEKLSNAVRNILVDKKQSIENVIKVGQEDGSIRKDISPSQLAPIFMGSMRFVILQWRLENYEFDLIKEGKKLWEAVSKLLT